MKKVFLALITSVFLAGVNLSCNLIDSKNQQTMSKSDSLIAIANAPIIAFEQETFDFGKMAEGDSVQHAFKFKNIGKTALQITDVQVQCGCTVASKPDKPVGVGESDEIIVRFNSKGKAGINKKYVTVYSNANPSQRVLSFTAVVAEDKTVSNAVKAAIGRIPKL